MRPRAGEAHGAGAPALRCYRCGRPVEGTRHTRTGWTVGHYLLHGGRTEEATLSRGLDEEAVSYRRLVAPVVLASCAACFAAPDVRRMWAAFAEPEAE